jgi:hypothetical protein
MEKDEIFEINGVKYKHSTEPWKDGDEVFCIFDHPDSKVPYGTKGKIVSMWYDRVEFLGNEYVIWRNQTAKLIAI